MYKIYTLCPQHGRKHDCLKAYFSHLLATRSSLVQTCIRDLQNRTFAAGSRAQLHLIRSQTVPSYPVPLCSAQQTIIC